MSKNRFITFIFAVAIPILFMLVLSLLFIDFNLLNIDLAHGKGNVDYWAKTLIIRDAEQTIKFQDSYLHWVLIVGWIGTFGGFLVLRWLISFFQKQTMLPDLSLMIGVWTMCLIWMVTIMYPNSLEPWVLLARFITVIACGAILIFGLNFLFRNLYTYSESEVLAITEEIKREPKLVKKTHTPVDEEIINS